MSDDTRRYPGHIATTAERPLAGLTVLVVEDSIFASEAIRLMCLRSGARIRRADSVAAAHRHLAVYRPNIMIADMGLPDGNGAALIGELAQTTGRETALVGMSGDPGAEAAAFAAGADGFLAKPVESLALFQQTLIAALPIEDGLREPWVLPADTISPDPAAFKDDLAHAADIMRAGLGARDYVAQFLGAVARSAHDAALEAAAADVAGTPSDSGAFSRLAGLVDIRIGELRAG